MTVLKKNYLLLFFLVITNLLFAQSNTVAVVTQQVTKEIEQLTIAENSPPIAPKTAAKYTTFKAEIWPNPSNLGKV